jgi:hypothetical protein
VIHKTPSIVEHKEFILAEEDGALHGCVLFASYLNPY